MGTYALVALGGTERRLGRDRYGCDGRLLCASEWAHVQSPVVECDVCRSPLRPCLDGVVVSSAARWSSLGEGAMMVGPLETPARHV
jgi:hypothetical protein